MSTGLRSQVRRWNSWIQTGFAAPWGVTWKGISFTTRRPRFSSMGSTSESATGSPPGEILRRRAPRAPHVKHLEPQRLRSLARERDTQRSAPDHVIHEPDVLESLFGRGMLRV